MTAPRKLRAHFGPPRRIRITGDVHGSYRQFAQRFLDVPLTEYQGRWLDAIEQAPKPLRFYGWTPRSVSRRYF